MAGWRRASPALRFTTLSIHACVPTHGNLWTPVRVRPIAICYKTNAELRSAPASLDLTVIELHHLATTLVNIYSHWRFNRSYTLLHSFVSSMQNSRSEPEGPLNWTTSSLAEPEEASRLS